MYARVAFYEDTLRTTRISSSCLPDDGSCPTETCKRLRVMEKRHYNCLQLEFLIIKSVHFAHTHTLMRVFLRIYTHTCRYVCVCVFILRNIQRLFT